MIKMKTSVIIPARWQSSRFPGKPLAIIAGKPMIQWVFEAVSRCEHIDQIWVATDNQKIFDHVNDFGGNAVMTSPLAKTGTDRALEALSHPELVDSEIIINVQGDEPLIPSQLIDKIAMSLRDHPQIPVFTAASILNPEEAANPNIVKVVIGKNKFYRKGLYFSRSIIPYVRDIQPKCPPVYYRHIGIYGFQKKALEQFCQLPDSMLEQCESLEQLRMLENGWDIGIELTDYEAIGVDTPQDIFQAEKKLLHKE